MKDKRSSIKIQYILQKFIFVLILSSCAVRFKNQKVTTGQEKRDDLALVDSSGAQDESLKLELDDEIKDPVEESKSNGKKVVKKTRPVAKELEGTSEERNFKKSIVTMLKPYWFKTLDKFKLLDSIGDTQVHMFYDVLPAFEKNKNTLNFIVATPEDSEYGYELDLASGQFYVDRKFCPHPDAYEKTTKDIDRPPFTIGIVPRVFDQLNEPQKIIVFGDKEYYQEFYKTNFFEARIIGGYVEQICPVGSCLEADDWLSRLVLVGVKPDSSKFKDIKNVNEVFKEVYWQKVVAFIENGYGNNILSSSTFPGNRMGALIDASQALYFLGENSVVLGNDQLKNIRKSCYKLYDYLYTYLNTSKTEFVKKETGNKLYVGDEVEIKNKLENVQRLESSFDFHQRFIRSFMKYHNEYKTCTKYIYPSNINNDPTRHWFFAYYTAFHKLHDLGYYYDCGRENWISNPLIGKDIRAVKIEDQFRACSVRSIDKGLQSAVTFLEDLKNKRRFTYRYIDYDNYTFGTHEKIYNWVKFDNKFLTCTKDKNELFFRDHLNTFPRNIKWVKREREDAMSTAGEIIE